VAPDVLIIGDPVLMHQVSLFGGADSGTLLRQLRP